MHLEKEYVQGLVKWLDYNGREKRMKNRLTAEERDSLVKWLRHAQVDINQTRASADRVAARAQKALNFVVTAHNVRWIMGPGKECLISHSWRTRTSPAPKMAACSPKKDGGDRRLLELLNAHLVVANGGEDAPHLGLLNFADGLRELYRRGIRLRLEVKKT